MKTLTNRDRAEMVVKRGPYYTPGQIAVILTCAVATVCKIIDAGQLKGFKVPGGRERRVLHGVLVKYLDDNNLAHCKPKIVD